MSVPSFSRLYCALGRHRLATLLGNHVGAIELEFGKVESFLYRGNTVDPDARETAIFAPLAEMVDRIMANHFANRDVAGCSRSARLPIGSRYTSDRE